jgi:hypothetical protein
MARPRLTVAQRQALAARDPAVPRHPLDLRQRDGGREQTNATSPAGLAAAGRQGRRWARTGQRHHIAAYEVSCA